MRKTNPSATDQDDAVKRPDVADRLRERKTLAEQCVKASLSQRLASGWHGKVREILIDVLQDQIKTVSEIVVRGSLIVNEVILQCLRHNRPLPSITDSFVKACFLQGIALNSRKSKAQDFSIVDDVFQNEFYDYPTIKRERGDGDGQTITLAAISYKTNLEVSIHHAFLSRQKAFIATWVKHQQQMEKEEQRKHEQDYTRMLDHLHTFMNQFLADHEQEKEKCQAEIEKHTRKLKSLKDAFKVNMKRWKMVSPFDMQCAINGWKSGSNTKATGKRKRSAPPSNAEMPQKVVDFITQERALLGNPKDFDPLTCHNVPCLLRYLFHILEYYREHKVGNGFSIAPVCRIRRHYIKIDNTVLYDILKKVSKKTGKLFPEKLQSIRNIPKAKLKDNKDFIDAMWKTTFNIDGLRKRRKFGHQIDTDGVAMVVHFNVKLRTRHQKQKRKRRKAKQTSQITSSSRIIAIDPGRSNLVTAFDSATSKTMTLTRRTYYQQSGINKANKKVAKWELPLQGIVTSLSKTSIRTSCARVAHEYRQTIIRNYDRLWDHRLERKRAKNALTVYSGKHRILDNFFAGLKTNFGGDEATQKRPIVIAYGAATVHPTGKGESTVPVKYVLKVCQRHYTTVMVNEHLTTKVHNVCHQRLHPVSRESEQYAIRGLCWCPTCTKFVSRDGNAARNILRVYRSMRGNGSSHRPHDLRFGQPKQEMATLPLLQGGRKQEKTWRALLSF